jgi:glycosyltransferase involved in cell wall biosynthesis
MGLQKRDNRADKDAPSVSVIIPAYNAARFIGETLELLFAQTYTDYEAIVINDGSPDTEDLERVIAPYRERIIYIKQENRGVSSARNTGIRAARSRYVATLDSDDRWEPDYLAVQVGMLERDPTIDVVSPDAIIFGESPHAGKRYYDINPSDGEITFERLVTQQCNVWTGVTARREAVLRAGLFDETLGGAEDYDLWLRILKTGGRIVTHRRVLAHFRKRRGSLSDDSVWMFGHVLRVLGKLDATLELTSSERKALKRQHRRITAMKRLYEGKKALFRGQIEEATQGLTDANTYFKSRKIALTLRLIKLSPSLIMRAYDMRDRFILKVSTRL